MYLMQPGLYGVHLARQLGAAFDKGNDGVVRHSATPWSTLDIDTNA